MAKRILIVATSHPEGVWGEELAVPYYTFKEHGCDVKVASVNGSIAFAEASLTPAFINKEVERFVGDDEAMKSVKESTPLSEVNPADFDAIYLPGGHGACFDFADSEQLITAISTLYSSSKVVAAVCHGPCGLVNVKGADGKPLVQGKKVTGFTDSEEEAVGRTKDVPFLLESRLKELGAVFERKDDWQPYAVRDGNLVTGQNPASSGPIAQLVLEALGVSS